MKNSVQYYIIKKIYNINILELYCIQTIKARSINIVPENIVKNKLSNKQKNSHL